MAEMNKDKAEELKIEMLYRKLVNSEISFIPYSIGG